MRLSGSGFPPKPSRLQIVFGAARFDGAAALVNVFVRAWRRLGRAQELVGIVGGMLAVLAACVAGFHAGYVLNLTHTHEVVTSCRPLANDYAFTELDLSSPPELCRMHDEPG